MYLCDSVATKMSGRNPDHQRFSALVSWIRRNLCIVETDLSLGRPLCGVARRSKRPTGDRGAYIRADPDHQPRLWLSQPQRRVCVGVVACQCDTIRFTDDRQCRSTASSPPLLELRSCHCVRIFICESQADRSQFRPTSGIFEGSLVQTSSVRSRNTMFIDPITARSKRVRGCSTQLTTGPQRSGQLL